MDMRSAVMEPPDPDAIEFVRFCYRRRRVGWPDLYDEMCAVAGRSLFRGYGSDDLAAIGIGFSLFDMPALAVLASRVVCEEQALRRPTRVTMTGAEAPPPNISSQRPDAAAMAVRPRGRARHEIETIRSARCRSDSRSRRRSAEAGHFFPSISTQSATLVDLPARVVRFDGRSVQARIRRLAISPSIWRSAST